MKNYQNIWPGIVENNIDPEKRGRLQIRVGQIFGEVGKTDEAIPTQLLPWALPCFPTTGVKSGVSIIPEIGAGVWVMFVQGDCRNPVWLGGWYAQSENTTGQLTGYLPNPRNYVLIETPKGHSLLVKDTPIEAGLLYSDFRNQKLAVNSVLGLIEANALQQIQTSAPITSITSTLTSTISATALPFAIGASIPIALGALLTLSSAGIAVLTAATGITLLGSLITLGLVGQAQKLLKKDMMDLYNSHTHSYLPGDNPPAQTGPPNEAAEEDTHTTTNTMAS